MIDSLHDRLTDVIAAHICARDESDDPVDWGSTDSLAAAAAVAVVAYLGHGYALVHVNGVLNPGEYIADTSSDGYYLTRLVEGPSQRGSIQECVICLGRWATFEEAVRHDCRTLSWCLAHGRTVTRHFTAGVCPNDAGCEVVERPIEGHLGDCPAIAVLGEPCSCPHLAAELAPRNAKGALDA